MNPVRRMLLVSAALNLLGLALLLLPRTPALSKMASASGVLHAAGLPGDGSGEKRRKAEHPGGGGRATGPAPGHVWCGPSALVCFLSMRSTGEAELSPQLSGLLGLSGEQVSSFTRLAREAVESVLERERRCARLVEEDGESHVEIPPAAEDSAGLLISRVRPPLSTYQTAVLGGVLRAAPWFEGERQTRILALEEDSEGDYYFTWRGSNYRLNADMTAAGAEGPWAEFTDRFGHLADFSVFPGKQPPPK